MEHAHPFLRQHAAFVKVMNSFLNNSSWDRTVFVLRVMNAPSLLKSKGCQKTGAKRGHCSSKAPENRRKSALNYESKHYETATGAPRKPPLRFIQTSTLQFRSRYSRTSLLPLNKNYIDKIQIFTGNELLSLAIQ